MSLLEGPRNTRVLHWQKVVAQEAISNSVLQHATFELDDRMILGGLVARLESFVLTEHLESTSQKVSISVPRSWWQHFKLDVLDRTRATRWFVRRYPPLMKKWSKMVFLSADWRYANYPQLPESQYGKPVIVETFDTSEWYQG